MTRIASLAFLATIACGAPAPQAIAQGPTPAGSRIYVTNQENASVSILDGASGALVQTLDLRTLGFSENAKPHDAAVEPDGSHWYVTLIGENRILKLNRNDAIVGFVTTPVPGLLALAPDADVLYAARSMSAVNPPASFVAIRRSDMTLVEEVDVLVPRPHAIETTRDGRYVYVASLAQNRLIALDMQTGVAQIVDVEGPTHTIVEFGLSPDGRWLASTAQLTGKLFMWDLGNPARPVLAHTIPVGQSPWHPTFTRDGCEIYVPNLDANTVSVVDVRRGAVSATITDERFAQPHGSTVGPNGWIYVTNRNQAGDAHDHEGHEGAGVGRVVAIDPATRQIVASHSTGRYSAGVGSAASYTGSACR
ncbi:MAG: beta-propeller fold lactonase family protein [Gemmatimonadales bacterium]